jgi:hypothetical protein
VKEGLIAKSVTEKNNEAWIVRRQGKRLCKPRGTRGEDFCLPVIAPAQLPVSIYQVKPDRFLPNSIPS